MDRWNNTTDVSLSPPPTLSPFLFLKFINILKKEFIQRLPDLCPNIILNVLIKDAEGREKKRLRQGFGGGFIGKRNLPCQPLQGGEYRRFNSGELDREPLLSNVQIRGGGWQKWNFFVRTFVFTLTCLDFSHLHSILHLRPYIHQSIIFYGSKQFLNVLILIPVSASAMFCFTSSTLVKHFLLKTVLKSGETEKGCSEQDLVNREGVVWGSCHFWSKTAEHSTWCGQVRS